MKPQRLVCGMLIAASLLCGCDYVDDPLEGVAPGPVTDEVTRRVLIEDFTGHTCPNCPSATALGLQLQDIYGSEKVILVGVHVTDVFAAPVDPIGDGEFDTDFRTPAGTAYGDDLGLSFLPVGAVNRTAFNGSVLLGEGSWSSAVAAIIEQPAALELWFDTLIVDDVTGAVSATVGVAVLQGLSGTHNLVVYLTEDEVVADQIDAAQSPSHVHDYVHRHALRDNVNGTWGEAIVTGTASAGDTLSSVLSYTLPSNVLDASHCSLVAYVYNVATNEILQVVERKF